MKRRLSVLTVAFVASTALVSPAAFAEPSHAGAGGRSVVGGGHSIRPHPGVSHGMVPRPVFPRFPFRHRFHRSVPFGVGVVYASPDVSYGSPGFYDQSGYYERPAAYEGPAAYTRQMVAPPPPLPSVVEFPNGRYELRGDGVTTPYQWVWVPHPPPPPPTAGVAPPAEESPIYRWKDEQGEVHWTNRLNSVPQQYRSQAERLAL